jgi:hypothetical protein
MFGMDFLASVVNAAGCPSSCVAASVLDAIFGVMAMVYCTPCLPHMQNDLTQIPTCDNSEPCSRFPSYMVAGLRRINTIMEYTSLYTTLSM